MTSSQMKQFPYGHKNTTNEDRKKTMKSIFRNDSASTCNTILFSSCYNFQFGLLSKYEIENRQQDLVCSLHLEVEANFFLEIDKLLEKFFLAFDQERPPHAERK